MAAIFGQQEKNIKLTGQEVSVPQNDICKLSYYLNCIDTNIIEKSISRELVDYKNAYRLPSSKQDVIVGLCITHYNALSLMNKIIILDDKHEIIPNGWDNKFCELHEVTSIVAVSNQALVGGQQTEITKVLICTTKWLERFFMKPLKNNKKRIERIAECSYKDTEELLNTIENGLAIYQLAECLGDLTTTTDDGSHHTTCTCDGVGCKASGFSGPRFKCLDCFNYDLCQSCYNKGIDGHTTHTFGRIDLPGNDHVPLKPRERETRHKDCVCDGVQCRIGGFTGPRFKCLDCSNYDLCGDCYNKVVDGHTTHIFGRIDLPGDRAIPLEPRVELKPPPATNPAFATPVYVVTPPTTPSAPVAEAVLVTFSVGEKVRLVGLLSDTTLNGRCGVIVHSVGVEDYLISIPEIDRKVSVKATNLETVTNWPFPLDALVELTGLKKKDDNGKCGLVINYIPEKQRSVVKLLTDENRTLSLLSENLTLIEELA